jgi:drug/metabolite transporter (DMT)-like permease
MAASRNLAAAGRASPPPPDGENRDHGYLKVLPPVLLCALLWGSAFPGIKTVYRLWDEAGVATGLTVYWWFAGVRFTLAGLLLLAVARRPLAQWRAAPKLGLAKLALFQTVGQYLLFYWGLALASGSLAALLASAGSFWWMLLAPLLARAPWPSGRQWLAVAAGALGLVIATAEPGTGAGRPWLGALLIVAASGSGTLGLIEFGKFRGRIGARAATGFALFGGGLALLAVGAGEFDRAAELMSPAVILLTVWLAFVSAAAFGLWNHLSTRHPVPLLAGYRFLIPLAGMFEALIFLPDESAGWGLMIGAVLIVFALMLAQRWRADGAPPAIPR